MTCLRRRVCAPRSPRRAVRRRMRLAPRLLLALLVALTTLLTGAAASASASASAETSRPQDPADGPLLGAVLSWDDDSPTGYRDRLGAAPAAYGFTAPMPMRAADVRSLRTAVAEADDARAGLVVTIDTDAALSSLGDRDAAELVDNLLRAGVGTGDRPVWLRPLPAMNAPWVSWGQQPIRYVEVFRALADEAHARLQRTAVVWQPAEGAAYPFLDAPRAAPLTGIGPMDTDGDGLLTGSDDPYGPYWPGDDAVDWVGLAVPEVSTSTPANEPPPQGRLADQLTGRFGYPDPAQRPPADQRHFYDRYVAGTDRPMLLETGAPYLPARPGAERPFKTAWFEEVRAVVTDPPFSGIGMVLWQETRGPDAATPVEAVDRRATTTPGLAEAFEETVVRGGGLTLAGPAAGTPGARPTAEGPGFSGGTILAGHRAVLASSAVGLVGVALVAAAGSRRRRGSAYSAPDAARDLRIDLLRGVAICFVVVDHLTIESLWQLLTQELIGPLSGAELFVSLSGVILGVVHGRRTTDLEKWYSGAERLWRRALVLWVTALVVVVVVYLVSLLPGINARVLTTFDPTLGTEGAGGRSYPLYAGFSRLADYPVPGWALRDLLLLRMGPSQVNIIGLYVVLLLLAPLFTYLLFRGRWAVLVAASLGLYTLSQLRSVRVLPSQFEDPFPLLSWQVLFVLGLVAGWHRTRLLQAARRPLGRALVVGMVLAAIGFALFSLTNPFMSNAYDVRLALLPDATFTRVYAEWFDRTTLAPGRLVAVVCLLVAAYAALTSFWVPVERALGWFLVPMGQATLYIFVVNLVFVVLVANLPVLSSSLLVGTLTHTVVLLLLWLMVRRRLLFGVIPR